MVSLQQAVTSLDENAIRGRVGLQGNATRRPAELECILKQVGDGAGQDLTVSIDGQPLALRGR